MAVTGKNINPFQKDLNEIWSKLNDLEKKQLKLTDLYINQLNDLNNRLEKIEIYINSQSEIILKYKEK